MLSSACQLHISANGRYFVEGQQLLFWLGDTQWNLFRCHTLEEARTIFEDRRAKGFTFIQVMLMGCDNYSASGDVNYIDTELLHGEAFPTKDPAVPNLRYFEHVDAVVALAHEYGIYLVIGIDHPSVRLTDISTAHAYGRWVGERYRDAQYIIWVASYMNPEGENLAIMEELAAGLREGDGGCHLITCHPDPATPVVSSGAIHNSEWLAFNCIQTFKSTELVYEAVQVDYRHVPPKPVVMAEGAYEDGPEYGFPITPLVVRRQAYWSYLAGGHHSYGHNDNWRMNPTWQASLNAQGARHLAILQQLFTARHWWDLVPDQGVFAEGAGAGNTRNVAARANTGDWLIVYLSHPCTVGIHLQVINTDARVIATWIDPTTGTSSMIGEFPVDSTRSFTCPDGMEDAVLLVEAGCEMDER